MRTASGAVPAQVLAAVTGGAGRTVASGAWPTLGDGRVRISGVAAEGGRTRRFELLVRAAGTATLAVAIEAPGEAGTLVLPAAARLRLSVAELAADGAPAAIRLVAADGRPYRSVGSAGTLVKRWPLAAGRVTLGDLAPGVWFVRVEAADGRSWNGGVELAAGAVVELGL